MGSKTETADKLREMAHELDGSTAPSELIGALYKKLIGQGIPERLASDLTRRTWGDLMTERFRD